MTAIETKTYVQCASCSCRLSAYFASFKTCPICSDKALTVAKVTGINLPETMELDHGGKR